MQFNGSGSTASPTPASFTQPSPGPGRRNVITGVSATYSSTAGAIVSGTLVLRDNISGGPPTIILLPARTVAANEQWLFVYEFATPIYMSVDMATTLEFTAIVAAGGSQVVNLKGFVI